MDGKTNIAYCYLKVALNLIICTDTIGDQRHRCLCGDLCMSRCETSHLSFYRNIRTSKWNKLYM